MCYTVFRKRKEKKKERITMENINERIAKLEKAIFYLDMKDHWSWHDFQDMDKMKAELHKLEKERDAQ